MQRLRRIDAALARAESWLLVASLLGILALGVLQILLRISETRGLDWADEVMRNLTLWVGFVGASVASWEGKHINVDALTRFLGPRVKRVLVVVVDVVAAGVSGVLTYSAASVLTSSLVRLGEGDPAVVLPSGVPVAVWQSLLPVGCALISVRFLFKAAQAVWELRTGGEVKEVESEGASPPGEKR